MASVGIDAVRILQQRLKDTVDNHRVFVTQADQLLIIVEDGIRISQRCPAVDFTIVGIHGKPRRTSREAGILAVVPLHRCPRVVAAIGIEAGKHGLWRDHACVLDILLPGIDFLNIPAVLYGGEMHVCHSDLFALVDVRRPLHHVQAGRQHLGGDNAILRAVVSEAGDRAWLVVVVPEKAVPG